MKHDLFMSAVEMLVFGFINGFEKKLMDPFSSTIPNDIKHLICEFYHVSSKIWDGIRYHYAKIYSALHDIDFEQNGVQISVPEFVFLGFGSRRLSMVSHVATVDLRCFIGSRYPIPFRFKLTHNPNAKKAVIEVNGEICRDESDMRHRLLYITRPFEEEQNRISSKDMIEIRIESSQVSEITFVYLPELLKGRNPQFAEYKRQIDEMTAWFLHQQNPDGSYRYLPILVRHPVDVECDTHYEVTRIHTLVEKYGGTKKRANWMSDTLFIVNQFDRQINRSPASSLIEYMKYCQDYGQTVLTMTDAGRRWRWHHYTNIPAILSHDSQQQLLDAERDEEERWTQVLAEFSKMDDPDLPQLKALRAETSGIRKMNEVLASKMCDIVKTVLPLVERRLRLAEHDKKRAIAHVMKQIGSCDDRATLIKIKQKCVGQLKAVRKLKAKIDSLKNISYSKWGKWLC